MVNRCVFSTMDDKIVQEEVCVAWDLGFTREAKSIYVSRIADAFGKPVVDTTTASCSADGRALSPLIMKVSDFLESADCGDYNSTTLFYYVYLNSLNDYNKEVIRSNTYFSDVFYNPNSETLDTQAYAVCLYKLLEQSDCLEMLESYQAFEEWLQGVKLLKVKKGEIL